jgi:hypothetical protein
LQEIHTITFNQSNHHKYDELGYWNFINNVYIMLQCNINQGDKYVYIFTSKRVLE